MARTKKPIGPTCDWTLADEDASHYETSCGNAFIVLEGTPAENQMRFCPCCGRKLKEGSR